MFTNTLRRLSNTIDSNTAMVNYFDSSEVVEGYDFSQQNETRQKPYTCLFQPIYRREDDRFVPAGHKVVTRPTQGSEQNARLVHENSDTNSCDLFRVLEMGACQLEVIMSQVDVFLAHKRAQDKQKLVFEIDIFEFSHNPNNLTRLQAIISDAELRGIKPSDIVIEISGSTVLDPGIVYTIAMQLKEMGIMLALNNLDADSFSFKRVFQIWPHVVKFNRSWCDLPIDDPCYLEVVRTLVHAIAAKGIHTTLTDVQNKMDLRFAALCKFTRCQGSFFGDPTPTMDRGLVYKAIS